MTDINRIKRHAEDGFHIHPDIVLELIARLETAQAKIAEQAAAIEKLRDALTLILEFAEQHPVFMVSTEDAESEGGDAAFVTVDIAETARHALDCENRRFAEAHVEIKQLRDALVTIGDARPGSISFLDLQAFARDVLKGLEK